MRMPRPKQDLIETMDDADPSKNPWGQGSRSFYADSGDDLAHAPPGHGQDHGLAGMRFECPYCAHPLPSHARRCVGCQPDL